MKIKSQIRKNTPEKVYFLAANIKATILNVLRPVIIATNYSKLKRRYNAIAPQSNRIRIVFIVQRTEVFNSVKTVFQAACNNFECETYLLPIPRWDNKCNELAMNSYDSVFEFCVNQGMGNVIDSYNLETKTFFDLRQLNPNYVFLNVPYTSQYPSEYSIENLALFTKVSYIPYGYPLLQKLMPMGNSMKNLQNLSFVFSGGKMDANYCRKYTWLSEILSGKRVYNIGFPRFDLVLNSDVGSKKTILWIPRWTANVEKQKFNEQSSFMLFYEDFLKYAEENSECEFIIRPHPLMFENFIRQGVMTEEEKNKLLSWIHSIPNVELDLTPDYLQSLQKADILLADFSSIVVEYFVTNRPVVYFGNQDAFSKYDIKVVQSFYKVNTWGEAESVINDLLNGYDSKNELRRNAIQNFLNGREYLVGEKIIDLLIRDYYGQR